MSQGCGRRQIVAAAGVAALMGLGSGLADAQQAAFARIAVSEKSAVYVRIQSGELRAAMSAEGLQTAEPLRMSAGLHPRNRFPRIHAARSGRSAPRRHCADQGKSEVDAHLDARGGRGGLASVLRHD